ncbi:MAG: hypothetical protein LCH53_13660 [Bacteroidetes bacterium]|nr:hypothetical protein [Bacteroidota bacterium]
MNTFLSVLAINLRKEQEKARLRPAPPWSGEALTEAARMSRVTASLEDFWAFDRIYFPPEVYTQGYFAPDDYHRHLVEQAGLPGVYIHLGARDHGKTVTMKKYLAWRLLTGRTLSAGTYSATLRIAKTILRDVKDLVQQNPRILHDWRPRFLIDNTDEAVFTTEAVGTKPAWRFLSAFSPKRSVRGDSKRLARPEYILCDDIENRQSPMGDEQVRHRGKTLAETRTSMSREGTTLVALGNDFDERCLMHSLYRDYKDKQLDPSWRVERWPAWSDDGAPLWPERFPATDMLALRTMLAPANEDEWQGDYLQNPQPPAGHVFKNEHYREWDAIPPDARGVLYVDPNLSIKSKGDTTAMVALLFSPSRQQRYVAALRCRSYADSNDLLDDLAEIKGGIWGDRIVAVGMDGNVSQESTWTNHVRNWSRLSGRALPPIVWCRYHVDDLAKNTASWWASATILFPPGTRQSDEGARFINQVLAFRGKRTPSQQKDDAPDALVCADELLSTRGMARSPGGAIAAVPSIPTSTFTY